MQDSDKCLNCTNALGNNFLCLKLMTRPIIGHKEYGLSYSNYSYMHMHRLTVSNVYSSSVILIVLLYTSSESVGMVTGGGVVTSTVPETITHGHMTIT